VWNSALAERDRKLGTDREFFIYLVVIYVLSYSIFNYLFIVDTVSTVVIVQGRII